MAMESTPNSPASTSANNDLTKDDILDALSIEDVDEKPEDLLSDSEDSGDRSKPSKDKSKDDKSEEELDEKKDSEKKDDDEEEKELELKDDDIDIVAVPRKREILAKYPKLFKDFPHLEKAMYRERAYSEVLPTVEDAKVAVEKSNTFDEFEKSLLSGSNESVLKSIKTADPKAFDKIVDNYLEDLNKVDPQAYLHVAGTTIKRAIVSMIKESRRLGEENGAQLGLAATILNQFVFGNSEFVPPVRFAKEPENNPEADRLKSERQAFVQERFDAAKNELQTKTTNAIKSTIANNIDPTGVMSDYIKRNAVKDALEFVDSAISSDSRYRQLKDKLWEKAFQSNFSRQSVDAIKNAHLGIAKTVIRDAIKKARNEALKGTGKRVDDSEKNNDRDRSGLVAKGRSGSESKDGKDKSQNSKPTGRLSTLDFLNSD